MCMRIQRKGWLESIVNRRSLVVWDFARLSEFAMETILSEGNLNSLKHWRREFSLNESAI